MITGTRIDDLRKLPGMGWITALKAPAVAALAREDGPLQMSLFGERNLAEIAHPDYPGERLICCRNPFLAAGRARKRQALLAATETDLAKIRDAVNAGRLEDPDKIGIRASKVIGKHKAGKHFVLDIAPGRLAWHRDEQNIAAEAALDGIYVIRTSVTEDILGPAAVVTACKNLKHVERDFRIIKAGDLDLRPIRHYLTSRVRGHVLLCMLAAYLTWHVRQALVDLTFTDQHIPSPDDPVAPARRSAQARAKDAARHNADQLPVRRYGDLLTHPPIHPRPPGHHLQRPADREAHHPHPRPAQGLRAPRRPHPPHLPVASNNQQPTQLTRHRTRSANRPPSARSSKFGLTRLARHGSELAGRRVGTSRQLLAWSMAEPKWRWR
ncbi:MAG: IS1634 family transposase [Streptosporangiaceae bacterium]